MRSDSHLLAPPDPPHRELLARAAAGEPEAFGAIYQTYQHVVYRFGYAMTGSRDAAEDITQEVFVTLFREIARYDPSRASFTTYLYGIVRNMSRDRLRRERRFIPFDLIGLGVAAIHESDPFDAIDGAEMAASLRGALRRLPTRYRELIVLCDLHGQSYADAARVTGCSIAAVRSRLHRGRAMLRKHWSRLREPSSRRRPAAERCAYDV